MKTHSSRWLLLVGLLALMVVAGCYPTRIGTEWPSLGVITVNGQTQIVVAYNEQIALLNPSNGAVAPLRNAQGEERLDDSGNPRRWVLNGNDFDRAQFFAQPLDLGDNLLLFPAYNNRIVEVDLLTARVTNTTGIPLTTPVIADIALADGVLYVPLKTAGIAALERETYSTLWTAPKIADTPNQAIPTGVWATPLVHEGVVYVPTLDHYLYAIDAETGEVVWDVPVDLEGAIVATPLLLDGFLYVGSFSHSLYKISLAGEIVASYKGNGWIWSTPVYRDGVLYVTDLGGYVHAVNPVDMSQVWSVRVSERGIRPAPIVTDTSVIVAARNGKIFWLDRADGITVFEREIEGNPEVLSDMLLVEANPDAGVDEAMILVGTVDNGRLVASFSLENGRSNWIYGR